MAVFFVGEVNRLVNLVRDLCLLLFVSSTTLI